MSRLKALIILMVIFSGCYHPARDDETSKVSKAVGDQDKYSPRDTTPRVTGIGGIFFFSEHPQEAKEWYGKNLGLEINQYGSTFEFRNADRPEETNYLQWSPFKKGHEYFSPSKREFMINYRVQNLESLIKKLKANGVTMLDTVESYEYGKFVHIMDPDGTKIELWEPVDSVLTKLGGKTTK